MSNKYKTIAALVAVAAIVIAIFAVRRGSGPASPAAPGAGSEVSAPGNNNASDISAAVAGNGSQTAATGDPDRAVDRILDDAAQEQSVANEGDDETDSITAGDNTINSFDGIYDENSF